MLFRKSLCSPGGAGFSGGLPLGAVSSARNHSEVVDSIKCFLSGPIRTTNTPFLCFLRRKTSSCLFHQLVGGGLTSDQEARENGAPSFAYLIQVAALDLVEDAVSAEHPQHAANACRAAFGLGGIGSGRRKQMTSQIPVRDAADHEFSQTDDFQQCAVVG